MVYIVVLHLRLLNTVTPELLLSLIEVMVAWLFVMLNMVGPLWHERQATRHHMMLILLLASGGHVAIGI